MKVLLSLTLISTALFTQASWAETNMVNHSTQSTEHHTKSWIIQDITNNNHLMRADQTVDEHGIIKTTYTPLVYANTYLAKMAALKNEEEKIKNGQ